MPSLCRTSNSLEMGYSFENKLSVTSNRECVQESHSKQPAPFSCSTLGCIKVQRCGQWSHLSPITPGKHSHRPV